ncbi:MAG: hypothetical protein NTAFB05_24070 [Nitrobacter sp.]|uniref:esterase-like activity of phytase family protein n=1 Tax=Nitrobacter sp. TaxID=29420 RepID=UPI00387DE334
MVLSAMVPLIDRRRLLSLTATGLVLPHLTAARAQFATHPRTQPPPDELTPPAPVSITVNARPISSFDLRDRSRTRFGALAFRSGLVLTSSFPGFGGLSSLRLDPSGRQFISASDKGTWFTGRIVYESKKMTGLADVEAAPMLGRDGRPITAHGRFDTESIALDGSFVYVGIERVNRIMRFDFGKDFTRARGEDVEAPPAVRRLPFNRGLEALVVVPPGRPLSGTLIAISERGLDAGRNVMAFLIGGPSPGQFAIRRTDNFDISDACLLPTTGDLLILERKFSLTGGIGVRIRRIAMTAIEPGALVDGPSIFGADLGQEIDNFEGLDAFVDDNGDIVVTLVSDDNFLLIQRTLLLQFTLAE